jgi:hypothetical protein
MKRTLSTLLLLAASAAIAAAQTPDSSARAALSALPESQAVVYMNARRIMNEVLPRVVKSPELLKGVAELKQNLNVDARNIEFVVAGVRLTNEGAPGVVPVEFGLVVRGGFDSAALLSFARMSAQGKYRQETRAGKTVDVFKIDYDGEKKDENKDAADKPTTDAPPADAPKPKNELPSEIAAVALDADSILVGTQTYVFAALDARSNGGARLSPALSDLAMRDPDALVSLAAQLPPNVSKYLDDATGKGAGGNFLNDETRRLLDSVRQAQASLNMTATRYGVQTILRMDTPEDARALSGLVRFGLNAMEGEASRGAAGRRRPTRSEQMGLSIVRSITNVVAGNEVQLGVGVPQTTAAAFFSDTFGGGRGKVPATTPARRARRPARRRA